METLSVTTRIHGHSQVAEYRIKRMEQFEAEVIKLINRNTSHGLHTVSIDALKRAYERSGGTLHEFKA